MKFSFFSALRPGLVDFWHKLIKQVSPATAFSISQDDVMIFVVGPSGSGKSWFVKQATQSESIKTSKDYPPSTNRIQAVRCELTDKEELKSIVFVDTPSFLTACDVIDASKEIKAWIDQIKQPPLHAGVIFMHRIADDPARVPIQEHLSQFAAAVPWLGNVVPVLVVKSHDVSSEKNIGGKIGKHEENLDTQCKDLSRSKWKPSIYKDHFHGEAEVAWSAIQDLIRAS